METKAERASKFTEYCYKSKGIVENLRAMHVYYVAYTNSYLQCSTNFNSVRILNHNNAEIWSLKKALEQLSVFLIYAAYKRQSTISAMNKMLQRPMSIVKSENILE